MLLKNNANKKLLNKLTKKTLIKTEKSSYTKKQWKCKQSTITDNLKLVFPYLS